MSVIDSPSCLRPWTTWSNCLLWPGSISTLAGPSAKIGTRLLKQWGFEDVFVSVAQEAENWSRQVEEADYCDLIQVAQLHCVMIGGRKMAAPAISEIPAFQRLGLENIDPESIIKEAKHEIHEIVDLLSTP